MISSVTCFIYLLYFFSRVLVGWFAWLYAEHFSGVGQWVTTIQWLTMALPTVVRSRLREKYGWKRLRVMSKARKRCFFDITIDGNPGMKTMYQSLTSAQRVGLCSSCTTTLYPSQPRIFVVCAQVCHRSVAVVNASRREGHRQNWKTFTLQRFYLPQSNQRLHGSGLLTTQIKKALWHGTGRWFHEGQWNRRRIHLWWEIWR